MESEEGEEAMSLRTAILRNFRASLDVSGDENGRQTAVSERLAKTPRNLIPARGRLPLNGRLALFSDQAEKVGATVARIPAAEEAPRAIADYLRARNLPPAVRMGNDPRLEAMPWDTVATLDVAKGASGGKDLTGVSHAFAGVAETGTLVLTSGVDNPTTLNFLPETHIIVVAAEDVTGDMETVWDRLRAFYGKGTMPRCVNMVSGPSRSADIEQTLLLGAHGPKDVHVLVVG